MRLLLLIITILLLASCSGVREVSTKEETSQARVESQAERPMNDVSKMLLIEGGKEQALGNNKRAMAFYLQALKADPTNDAAHYELSRLYQEADDMEKALIHAELAANLDMKNTWYQRNYAELLVGRGDVKKGVDIYKRLVDAEPKNLEYIYNLAAAYEQAGMNPEALTTYSTIERTVGIDPAISFRKQRILTKQGKIEEGAAEIKKLIQDNPQEIRYLGYLGEYYEMHNKPDSALVFYNNLLHKDADNPQVLIARADLLLLKGDVGGFRSAIDAVMNSQNLSLDDKIKVMYPLVDKMSAEGAFNKEYIEAAQRLTELYNDKAKPFALHGDFLYNGGRLNEAVAAYEESLKRQDDVFSVWEQIMFIHSSNRNYRKLVDVADRASEKHPEEGLAYYMSGFGNYQLKNYDQAIEVITRGFKSDKLSERISAEMYSVLGDSYHMVNNHKESDLSYDKALIKDPDNVYVLNNYSYYLSQRNENLEKATKMIERALELSPDNPSFLDTYAWVMFKRGNYEHALPYMEKAVELDKDNATLNEHYGDILFKLGRKAEAVKKWIKAAELGAVSDLLKRKINDKQLYE